jgi:hypothetical protein
MSLYFDELMNTSNATTTTTTSIAGSELAEFRAFRDNKIREAALAQGREQASAEATAAEAQADADALAKLTSKGLDLRSCFGNSSTAQGRNAITNLHRTSFTNKSGAYTRLRRLAREAGLVK